MITCAYYLGYPVPALLYDAERGNTHSRLVIFDYFATLTERGQAVPADIAKFIAKHLRLVIDGKQKPAEMFNPEGTKVKAYNPLPADFVHLFNFDTDIKKADIKAKFEAVGERLGMPESTVERQYYAHREYSHRLSRIQELLDERSTRLDWERSHEVFAELQRLTAIS